MADGDSSSSSPNSVALPDVPPQVSPPPSTPATITDRLTSQVSEEIGQIQKEVAEARKLGFKGLLKAYFNKFKGGKDKPPPRMATIEALYSWLTAFIGIGLIAALHYHDLNHDHLVLVVGSFGASAVLIFGATKSPLAQPRNFVGGHFLSAIVGVTVSWIVHKDSAAIACGIAVASAVAVMQLTNTIHPPGGATALIAVMSQRMAWGGYPFSK